LQKPSKDNKTHVAKLHEPTLVRGSLKKFQKRGNWASSIELQKNTENQEFAAVFDQYCAQF